MLREQALSLFDYLSSGKIIPRNERESDEMLVLDMIIYGKMSLFQFFVLHGVFFASRIGIISR